MLKIIQNVCPLGKEKGKPQQRASVTSSYKSKAFWLWFPREKMLSGALSSLMWCKYEMPDTLSLHSANVKHYLRLHQEPFIMLAKYSRSEVLWIRVNMQLPLTFDLCQKGVPCRMSTRKIHRIQVEIDMRKEGENVLPVLWFIFIFNQSTYYIVIRLFMESSMAFNSLFENKTLWCSFKNKSVEVLGQYWDNSF